MYSKVSAHTACWWKLVDPMKFMWLKRNITGSTGCQLGLFTPNWTHSDRQLWLAGPKVGIFPLLSAIFPHENKGQSSTSFPGCKVKCGGHVGMQGETFMQPSNFLASSSWKSFHCLPSPSNYPNTSEITASCFAANWEICFTALTVRKQNTPFGGGRIFLSHYCQSAVTDLDTEQRCVVFHLGIPTRALYPEAPQTHFYLFV